MDEAHHQEDAGPGKGAQLEGQPHPGALAQGERRGRGGAQERGHQHHENAADGQRLVLVLRQGGPALAGGLGGGGIGGRGGDIRGDNLRARRRGARQENEQHSQARHGGRK